MKRIISILFLLILPLAALAQTSPVGPLPRLNGDNTWTGVNLFNNGVTIHATGLNQGFISFSQSGASAGIFIQDTHFDRPTLVVQRTGTDGDSASSPTMMVLAGRETQWNQPIFQAGGCLALSGDNYLTFWGNGGLSVPGGIYDNRGNTLGKLSIDPVHRQLLAEDGITPILSWAGNSLQLGPSMPGALIRKVSIPANSGAPGAPGDFSFDATHLYIYTGNGTAHTWLKIAGANSF